MEKEIVFVRMLDATFIKKDIAILEKYGNVTDVFYKRTNGLTFLFDWFVSIFTFISLFRKSTHVFIWFADYHAFLPVLLGRIMRVKSFVFIGGYDAAHIPEINYGAYTNKLRAFCTKYSVRNADFLLPVADNLGLKIKKIVGDFKGKMTTIPFGFNSENWFCDSKKENIIITVAVFETERRMKIKGLDFFVELAEAMPDFKFYIVGSTPKGEELITCPENLILFSRTPQKKLRKLYSKAKIYAQFSISEGLPNAVIESMLCECIPIGTNVGGIPDIVGSEGFILKDRNLDEVKKIVNDAMFDVKIGKKARKSVLEKYPLHKREFLFEELLKIR